MSRKRNEWEDGRGGCSKGCGKGGIEDMRMTRGEVGGCIHVLVGK